MIDINRHRFFLIQILKDIYSDIQTASNLGFKGGTALMFFHDLPRFSVDLDFNLLNPDKEDLVYEKTKKIISKHGKIFDEAKKHFGPIIVLDYGSGERKLKIEISNRNFDDHYEIRNLLGINIKVMTLSDMLSHKLCALLDRRTIAARDIFDCWFMMEKQTPLNNDLIEYRMQIPAREYLGRVIDEIGSFNNNRIMSGMGELLEPGMKPFVKNKLKDEFLSLVNLYRDYPQ